jgi:hypothetical protein
MRRLLLFTGILITASGITWAFNSKKKPPEKKYKVEQSIDWWQHTLNVLEAAKTQLKQSDLPSKQVVFLSDSLLSPIQFEITKQVQDQLNAERAATKPKPDSSK